MKYLILGDLQIPLPFVSNVSWSKTSKTTTASDGRVRARGFGAVEVSLRLSLDVPTCSAWGLNASEWIDKLANLPVERSMGAAQLQIGELTVYPSTLFAITSINTTESSDASSTAPSLIECDITLSGVAVSKAVSRNEQLSKSDAQIVIPDVGIGIEGSENTIQLKDAYAINEFVRANASIRLGFSVGDDLALPDRESFFNEFVARGFVEADGVKWYVVEGLILDNEIAVTCSALPAKATQSAHRTWIHGASLRSIFVELGNMCGASSVDCGIDGTIDYYLLNSSPLEALQSVTRDVGAIIYAQNDVIRILPTTRKQDIVYALPLKETQFDVIEDNRGEGFGGVDWCDGVRRFKAGDTRRNCYRVRSSIRMNAKAVAEAVLEAVNFKSRRLRIAMPLRDDIGVGSALSLELQNEQVLVVVNSTEKDYLGEILTLEAFAV